MGLSQARTKQRIPLDPRNTNWTNDDNKYGHKMLEKMGWKKGLGLGMNNDGDTNGPSALLKADMSGMYGLAAVGVSYMYF